MNLPNKITVSRILLIPIFMIVLYLPIPYRELIALAIFIIAAATDGIDGHIARSRNLVTNFGKFLDPLADKLLVTAALVALVGMQRIPSWIVTVIIAREFAVTGIRLLAVGEGRVIAASMWGKYKTTFQMIMVILMIVNLPQLQLVTDIVMWIATILTVVSLIDYLVKNKQVIGRDF